MKYMMLIVDEVGFWEKLSEAKRNETFGRLGQWWGELSQKGKIGEGHQLQPASTATTVKVKGGKAAVTNGPVLVTDGSPGASTATVGGYGILNVADLDEALAIVKTWPGDARLEVRPIVERGGM